MRKKKFLRVEIFMALAFFLVLLSTFWLLKGAYTAVLGAAMKIPEAIGEGLIMMVDSSIVILLSRAFMEWIIPKPRFEALRYPQ